MFGVEQVKEKKVKKPKKSIGVHVSIRWKKILPWIGVGVLIILLVGYYLYKNYYSNYNYIKQDSSQYLVYTSYRDTNSQNMQIEIPFINIDSADANLVNETIQRYAEDFLADDNNLIVYDSQVNGEVLSVLLKMLDYRSGYSYPDVNFHTYNFNLRTQTLMSDEQVLALFDVTTEDVEKQIQNQFEFYYNDEVAEGYFDSRECNYECFLNWRGVNDYLDPVYYYIKNGNLVAYRPFSIYSVYGEEEYYDDDSYEFSITN